MPAERLLALPGDGRRELIEGVLHELTPAGGDTYTDVHERALGWLAAGTAVAAEA